MAFRNAAIAVGTTLTPLYTCPANYECVIHSLYFANTDTVNTISVDIEVTLTKAGLGSHYVGKNLTIPAGTSLIFDKPITLRETDIIKIKSSATTCDAVASFLLTREDANAPN
jgi:hypothetical protein